jgi:predicted  nucleic acid-binding Zn-ribbon protein
VLVTVPDGLPEADDGRQVADTALLEQIQTENEHLKQQLEQKDQQIEYLKEQIQEKDKQIERHQIIVMQLSRDIESQQKMLEAQTRRKGVSFWRRRVFGRRGASERE